MSDQDTSGEGTMTVREKIDSLSGSIDKRFEALSTSVDRRFDMADERFATFSASVDARFDALDVALIEQRQYTVFAFDRLDSRFDRLERKLDRFIDTQSKTNTLVERRLTALEPRSAQE